MVFCYFFTCLRSKSRLLNISTYSTTTSTTS
nr:MAG TPA: hypothetical protein [Microviridae sp.]